MVSPDPVISLHNVALYNVDSPRWRMSVDEAVRNGELVVGDVNIKIYPGELVYLIGRVGSGKSTLLKTLYAESPLIVGEG
ncbi:MAG: ATP-binding cassette domain-containing protein, partial [Rikenellaceae bacterium]